MREAAGKLGPTTDAGVFLKKKKERGTKHWRGTTVENPEKVVFQ